MCENKEVNQNNVLAELLVQNLSTMQAEACELPVKVGDKDYIVNVRVAKKFKEPRIGRQVMVYDRYRFAVPVLGVIRDISSHDGAYQVDFYSGQNGGDNVLKHNGMYFLQEQCRLVELK
jgi:hypothetical protein